MKPLLIAAFVLCSTSVQAQQPVPSPVTFAWDAVSGALGYRLYVDGQPSQWTATQSAPIPVAPGAHSAVVSAFNDAGESGPSMPPLAFMVQAPADPACTAPLGTRAVSIFVTALQKTGSGGALSRARLDFQLSSPNSPVTRVAVKTNGGDLSVMTGTALNDLAGMWFVVPAVSGTYRLSVSASNLYGCTTEVLTSKSVSVP